MDKRNQRDRGALVALALALVAILLLALMETTNQPPYEDKIQFSATNAEQDSDFSRPVPDSREFDPWAETYAQWLMTIFSVFATFISIWAVYLLKETLLSTREAVKAADDAVIVAREIGQSQVRAYVSVANMKTTFHAPNNKLTGISFTPIIVNYGASPAFLGRASHTIVLLPQNKPLTVVLPKEGNAISVTLPAGRSNTQADTASISTEIIKQSQLGLIHVVSVVYIEYFDVFSIQESKKPHSETHVSEIKFSEYDVDMMTPDTPTPADFISFVHNIDGIVITPDHPKHREYWRYVTESGAPEPTPL